MNWSETSINVLIALGLFGGARYVALWAWRRWRRGSTAEQQQAQISAAKQLQDISIELVEPIRQELRQARAESLEARNEAASARREANDLRRLMDETLESWLGWMQRAKFVLEANNLPVEPLPERPPIRRIQ